MFKEIKHIEDFNNLVKEKQAVVAFFSTTECQVCKVLKPKIEELFKGQFPKFELVYVETNAMPEVAAQNRIFAVPTIIKIGRAHV